MSEISREQEYIGGLYERVDVLRGQASARARQAKGLEFDSVLIAGPAEIIAASPRGRNDLYVAMTRSTQRLGVLHPGPPPAEIAALRPRALPETW